MSQKQARALIEQAKETLGSWSMFWSSNTNLETAAELYVRAGNSFQLVSMCKSFYSARISPYVFIKSLMVISALLILSSGQEAGDAYAEAAKLYKRADHSSFEAAQAFEKAAKSYKKVNPRGKPWQR